MQTQKVNRDVTNFDLGENMYTEDAAGRREKIHIANLGFQGPQVD